MNARFIDADSQEWGHVLSECGHDFYHLPGYTALSSQDVDGTAIAFLAEEGEARLFIPLVIRPLCSDVLETPLFDATSAYGCPGPLVCTRAGQSGEFIHRSLDALTAGLRERNVVSAFVRLHPTLSFPSERLSAFGRLVQHGETVSIDLTLSNEEMWRQTRRDHRSAIKKAERQGHVVRTDENWKHFDAFIDIYHETMRRVGANSSYYFSRAYLLALRAVLGDRLHLIVVEIDDQVAAAALFTEVCGIVQFHLSGTRDEYLAHTPSKGMINFGRQWAKSRGNHLFHLGGGLGASKDSLFQFKAGFSHIRHPFFTWRAVLLPSAYQALLRDWEDRCGASGDDMDGFFPAYRKPLPRQEVCPQ